jgi:hypothetical protein
VEARTAGFHSHLTKPLNLQALVEVVKQLEKERHALDGGDASVDYDVSSGPVC